MKITLFERWRRGGSKQRSTRKSRTSARRLSVESLESRQLLAASSVVGFATYDVNHDNYVNVLDVVKVVNFVNTNGMSSTAAKAPSQAGAVPAQLSASIEGAAAATATPSDYDVTGDGFVNVLDVVKIVKQLSDLETTAQYTLVPTDAADQPISGPITVGTTFYIDVLMQDLRDVPYAGLAAGDVDVLYTPGVTPTGTILAGANYPSPLLRGDTSSTPGVISHVQGFENINATGVPFFYTPLGGNALILNRIEMTATTAGLVKFNSQFSAGAVTVYAVETGNNDPAQVPANQISLGNASITVIDVPPVPGTLSGTIFVDNNGDNTQNNGEQGLSGVTVELLDGSNQVVATTQTTNPNGAYIFSNVLPGTYSLHEVQPSGAFATGNKVGSVNGSSNGTSSGSDKITSITLGAGDAGTGYNFAVQLPASVSGREYIDANGNNVFDGTDAGLGDVTIELNGPNNSVFTTTTLSDGTYSFTNLLPGTYTVKEQAPQGVFATVANVGNSSGTADNATTISGITLGSSTTAANYNFGVQLPAVLKGTEYQDLNQSNSFDAGDTPLQGVSIQLLNGSGQVVAGPILTDSSGEYSFDGLQPGVYTVQELPPPAPFVMTTSTVGTASGTQIGFDKITGITLGSGTFASGYNFGVQNQTPIQVKYTLTATDVNGVPLAGSLIVGQTFFIDVTVQDLRGVNYAGIASGNLDVTYAAQGGGSPGAVPTGNIVPGPSYPVPTGTSHGNALGTPGLISNLQGAQEINASGVPKFYTALGNGVFLLDRVEMIATAEGVVLFNTQFAPGEVTIFAELTGANDPDVAPAEQIQGSSTFVTIVPAPPVPGILSGTVYVDANGDNVRQAAEGGVPGVTVQLLDSTNAIVGSPQTTDASGNYSFTGIAPGTYTVREVQPAGFFETGVTVGTINGVTNGSPSGFDTIAGVTIASANVGVGYNFAVQAPASIVGTEYVDTNGNNVKEAGEAVLAGVTIQLLDSVGGVVATTTTNANGGYSFTNLHPGVYSVVEVPPASPFFVTGSTLGNAGGVKSGLNRIDSINLGSGITGLGYNFAVQQMATLSGSEYIDENSNNSFDAGDSGLSGVTIQLLNGSNQVVATTTTASDGSYSFLVLPGTYIVHSLAPGGVYVQTTSNVGNAGGQQSGVDSITNVALGSGASGTGYNFGVQDHVPFSAEVRLAATRLDGSPLPAVIPGGETFWLYEFVTDLRQPTNTALGVLAAYTTITFDPSRFEVVSPLSFGPNYQNATQPSGIPGDLSNVGALAGSQGNIPPSLGNSEQLVFRVQLQAIGAGTTNIVPGQPTSTPANPLGIILYPAPPETQSFPLDTAAIHFVGLTNVQTSQPTFASIDPNSSITNSPIPNALKPITFTVHLTEASSAPVTLTYSTASLAGDTAVAGIDYLPALNQTVTIPAGSLTGTITIQAIGNALNQADKTFHVQLTDASDNIVVSANSRSALGTIHSGVAQPSVLVQSTTGTQGGTATFNVTLSAPSGQVVTIHYQTQPTNPQSAIPGTDYISKSGDVVFNPGDPLTKQVTITLPLNANQTSSTQFLLALSTDSNSHASLVNTSVLGTILPLATSSISGHVYYDQNNDGLRGAGETGYKGITIILNGTDIYGRTVHMQTATTDGGVYTFGGLVKGHYVITEMQPKIILQGRDKIGSQGGDDSVQDQFTIELQSGVVGTENNFGEAGIDPQALWTTSFVG